MPTATTFLVATLFGTLSAYLAHKQRKNPYIWFVLGFVFGILGVFAIFFLPQAKKRSFKRSVKNERKAPAVRGPKDLLWYYLDLSHTPQGPMSLSALNQALRQGIISERTYVWHEKLKDWVFLSDFLESTKRLPEPAQTLD